MISHDITHVFLQYLWSVFALHNPLLGNIQVKSKLDVLQLWIWGWACVTSCHTHRLLWNLERHVQSELQNELAQLSFALCSCKSHSLLCNEPMLVQVIGNEIRKPWGLYLEASTSRGIWWVRFLGFHEANQEANQGLAPFSDLCPTYRMEPRWTTTKLGGSIAFHCIPLHSIAFHCIPLHSIAFHCIPLHSIAFHCISCSEMLWIIQPDVSPVAICLLCACLVPPRFLLQKVKWPAQIVDWPGTYCLTLRKPCIE